MRTDDPMRPGSNRRRGLASAPVLLLAGVVLAVLAFVFISNRATTNGPVPVVWDKTPCAYCAMHVGDPRFAAQLSTTDGTTYFYDDPGCLFLHQRELDAAGTWIHARWFHEQDQDAWIEAEDVAFERCDYTPMDYGFGAVQRGDPASIGLDEAAAEVLAR